ncbi:hypothetical protein M9434_004021 [Picochlorum sp. BPE23]|nr:hypothetical protein M9434_004021 [Picochlorum sp. BPE23]
MKRDQIDVTEKVKDATLGLGRAVKAQTVVMRKNRMHKKMHWDTDERADDGSDVNGDNTSSVQFHDAYGFEIEIDSEDQENILRCLRLEQKQSVRWNEELRQHSSESLQHTATVKKLCRGGIPPELRKHVWLHLSGAHAVKHASGTFGYMYYIEKSKLNENCRRQIDLDVPRTFPNNQWIQSDVGQVSLKRVLYAFSAENTVIGYCQGMNYVASMLLLALEYDEEAAFWTMCCLIGHDSRDGILYHDLYANNLSGCHVEMRSLDMLVESKLPKLAKHMKGLECGMTMLATEWFLCLFSTTLPAETTFRIWDALFSEGPKILYRISIALLKLHESILLAAENSGELLRNMRAAAAKEYDRDELLHIAFDGIGRLPMNRIEKFRNEKQRMVDKEIALRETRAKLKQAVQETDSLGQQQWVMMEGEREFISCHEEDLLRQEGMHASRSHVKTMERFRNALLKKDSKST